eukprot:TRINITY_DN8105_c0_g2_i3.p1 TRINITY_DN8105_c0_g2~~TRINITY_DN8105_c0_g2_i3.p1  ORF type:complete len:267 (-),score=22.47 TRINITY_DN8105_c0_g2_i3:189-989(-)
MYGPFHRSPGNSMAPSCITGLSPAVRHSTVKLAFSLLILLSCSHISDGTSASLPAKKSSPPAPKGLPNGATCYFKDYLDCDGPCCQSGYQDCVISKVPTNVSRGVGTCVTGAIYNNTFCHGHMSLSYFVGTVGILTNYECVTCTCERNSSGSSPTCDCAPLPPCYVSHNGSFVGHACPDPQSWCYITQLGGGGKDKQGLPIDKGDCRYPDGSTTGGSCLIAGPSLVQPKLYINGMKGIPQNGNICSNCTCHNGQAVKCTAINGCKP